THSHRRTTVIILNSSPRCEKVESRPMPKLRYKRPSVSVCLLLILLASLLLPRWVWRQALLDHALMVAIGQSHASAVLSLLHAGANPNARAFEEFPASLRRHLCRRTRRSEDTALSLACYTGWQWNKSHNTISRPNEEIVLALLNAGAHP